MSDETLCRCLTNTGHEVGVPSHFAGGGLSFS